MLTILLIAAAQVFAEHYVRVDGRGLSDEVGMFTAFELGTCYLSLQADGTTFMGVKVEKKDDVLSFVQYSDTDCLSEVSRAEITQDKNNFVGALPEYIATETQTTSEAGVTGEFPSTYFTGSCFETQEGGSKDAVVADNKFTLRTYEGGQCEGTPQLAEADCGAVVDGIRYVCVEASSTQPPAPSSSSQSPVPNSSSSSQSPVPSETSSSRPSSDPDGQGHGLAVWWAVLAALAAMLLGI